MKFTSLQENLKQGLQTVSHVVSKNINLPILNNVLFRVAMGQVELVATNLEIGVIHRMRGKVEAEGDFTVDSRVIADYVNLLPSEKVSMEQIDGELKVECENYKTKIKIQPAQDFPLLPVVDRQKFYSVSLDAFKDALSQVIFAVANNETRLELSGVLMVFGKKSLTLVGTDSYRLAEKEIVIKSSDPEAEELKVIVPAKTLQELVRILSSFKEEEQLEGDGDIKVFLSDNQILFTFGSTELVSRLISGSYPDYKQIIPNNHKTQVAINKSELVRAIKASAIFSKAGINDVNLEFRDGQVMVSAISSQVGESAINLKGEISGDDNDVLINYRYLLDGLNNIEDSQIKIEIINSNSPCILRPAKDNSYQYIVMPIRQ
jgi:DNA polymerase-3 subunit beta